MASIRELRTLDDLDAALGGSVGRPLLLLKHSTRCHVSARAYAEFRRFAKDLPEDSADLAILYIVEDRKLSNEVATRLGVRHESPQALLISNGKVIWHDSHDGVAADRLLEALHAVGEPTG